MEGRKKCLSLFVRLSGCRNADVHTTELVDLVVFNFRENDLFLQTDVLVDAAVERAGTDTTEVTNTRESDSD